MASRDGLRIHVYKGAGVSVLPGQFFVFQGPMMFLGGVSVWKNMERTELVWKNMELANFPALAPVTFDLLRVAARSAQEVSLKKVGAGRRL